MNYRLIFTDTYRKAERKFLKRHPELTQRYSRTLELLETDPAHRSLRLHALEGQLQGLHSVSINLQYRITLELEFRDKEIVLIYVGSHGEVY